ncbi:MAG: hypothetical protein FJ216_01735 [Ignavibacteria bacterium]|nr:hypothetical protein [Ignavibacteria bacterium]
MTRKKKTKENSLIRACLTAGRYAQFFYAHTKKVWMYVELRMSGIKKVTLNFENNKVIFIF